MENACDAVLIKDHSVESFADEIFLTQCTIVVMGNLKSLDPVLAKKGNSSRSQLSKVLSEVVVPKRRKIAETFLK